jgi:hypothetical protein
MYSIPATEISINFIIISNLENGNQLMPTTVEDFDGAKRGIMKRFHSLQLIEENLKHKYGNNF